MVYGLNVNHCTTNAGNIGASNWKARQRRWCCFLPRYIQYTLIKPSANVDTRSHQLLYTTISDGDIELHLGAAKIVVHDAASVQTL